MSKNYLAIEEEPRFNETIKILHSIILKEDRVIEIGASDASFKKWFDCDNWVTVDKFGSPDLYADLNARDSSLPLDDDSVDVVICTEVIEHLTYGSSLVREISRILKKDGRAIISVPNIVSLKSRIKVLFGNLPVSSASGDCGKELRGQGILIDGTWEAGHVVDFNAWRLRKYLYRGGLNVVKHWKMPVGVRIFRLNFTLPAILIPRTLTDILLFEVRPHGKSKG